MNQAKLDELKKQAQTVVGEGLGGNYYALDEDTFAELIVRECINLLPDDCQAKNGCHVSWNIKEHFGVK